MSTQNGLKRNSLSAFSVVILVLSAAGPLIGLTGAVPVASVLGGGNATPLAYVIVGAILLLFAVGYVAMSRKVTNTGALYAYIGRGLGLRMGLGGASIAVWSYTTIQVAIYGFFGAVAGGQIAAWTGADVPWWLCTIALVVIVQIFGWLNINLGALVLLILMLLEWGIMIGLAIMTFATGGAGEGLAADQVFDFTAVLAGGGFSIAIIFAFASTFGFESSAIYGEEVRDAKRSVGRATYASVLTITGFFLLTSWGLVVGYGPSNSVNAAGAALESGNPAAYVFDSAATYLGPWAPDMMSILVMTSMFACALAFHNGISRYLFTLGRDHVLPTALGRTAANGSPRTASVTQTVSILAIIVPFAIAGADPVGTLFFWGSGIAVIGILILYIGTSVAVVRYFLLNKDDDTPLWNRLIAPATSAVILAIALWLIVSNFELLTGGTHEFALGLASTAVVAFVIGLVLYGVRVKQLNPSAAKDLADEIG